MLKLCIFIFRNPPLKNGGSSFFTENSYNKYTLQIPYKQYLITKDRQLWGPREHESEPAKTAASKSDEVIDSQNR